MDSEHHVIGARKEDILRVSDQDARSGDIHSQAPPGRHYTRTTQVATTFPENRQKIITVDSSDPAIVGFKTLIDHKILSVPVYNSRRETYVGFLDTLDMVYVILDLIEEADLSGGRFGEILESSQKLKSLTCGKIVDSSGRNPWYPVQDTASLSHAIQTMVSQKAHRVPVIDATGSLLTILTQSHIVSLLRKKADLLRAVNRTAEEMGFTNKQVLTIQSDKRAIDAFRYIYQHKVSGVAVVDSDGKLIGNISATDLRVIGWDGQFISRLFLPVTEYFAHCNMDLKGAHTVSPTDNLRTILSVIDGTKSHRVYVADSDKTPLGVVSLTDILEVIARTDC